MHLVGFIIKMLHFFYPIMTNTFRARQKKIKLNRTGHSVTTVVHTMRNDGSISSVRTKERNYESQQSDRQDTLSKD